jgi:hypothetical protein
MQIYMIIRLLKESEQDGNLNQSSYMCEFTYSKEWVAQILKKNNVRYDVFIYEFPSLKQVTKAEISIE